MLTLPAHPASADAYCREVLPQVSRTFALNIPVLPAPLDLAVTVAYLLCRIADTLEDEVPGAAAGALLSRLARLARLPEGWMNEAARFTREAREALRPQAPEAEVRLLEGASRVLEALAGLAAPVRERIAECVETMSEGMERMGARGRAVGGGLGLGDLKETLEYCYYVAGVVGEMLTGLFAWHSKEVAARVPSLQPRAVAFGNALQLTNILKDVREDFERGSCWLPRTVLAEHGLTPETLLEPGRRESALAAHADLVAVAHRELDAAFDYTLALPRAERGLRLFCLWPLFLSVMTLRKLAGNPAVLEPRPVKISRNTVRVVVMLTRVLVSWDGALRWLYAGLTRALPRARAGATAGDVAEASS
ncbi:squalene/phytoene synthase family protein [Myxococcaceae bacterium GXIMD 01537]